MFFLIKTKIVVVVMSLITERCVHKQILIVVRVSLKCGEVVGEHCVVSFRCIIGQNGKTSINNNRNYVVDFTT